MSEAISQYLSLALGVAFSPAPIIAILVLCVIGRAKTAGSVFIFGWWLGIFLFMILSVYLSELLGQNDAAQPSPFQIIFKFLVAFLLLYLAWNNWRKRPKSKDDIKEPGWIAKLEKSSNIVAFGLGIAVSIINPKNIPIMSLAALEISQAAGSIGRGIMDIAIFALVSSIALIIPWIITLIGDDKMKPKLEAARDWLYQYNNIIMAVLFLYLGVNSLGEALGMLA